MKRRLTLGLCLLMAFVTGTSLAWAEDVRATSKVAAVTVYPRMAAVTRSGNVNLAVGPQTIIVENMPAGFVEGSLRVQGKGKSAVKIGSVEVKRVILAELAAATEQERAKALQAKRDEMALIDADLKALEVKAHFIERMADKDAAASENEKTPVLTPDKWAQAFGVVQTSMADTQKEIVGKEIGKRKVQEDIARLEKEYQRVKTAQRERRDVVVHVEAAEATDFDFTLTYQTNGVYWEPLYDARLDTDKGELKLEQYGRVGQQTGEDWTGVEISLSTSRPDFGTEMPWLMEWYIDADNEVRRQNSMKYKGREQRLMVSDLAAPAGMGQNVDAFDAPMQASKEVVASALVSAEVADNGMATEFRVPGRVDLKSIAEPSKFFIADVTMKATLADKTSPRKGAQAYLFATIENTAKYPLVPGLMAKYRDGAFMGNAGMKLLRPGEKESLSFGVDDRVKVTFQKTDHQEANPALMLIGDVSVERAYRIKVTSLHKKQIKIMVLDQYPVSRNPDIKVAMKEEGTTPGFVKDTENRQGVIQWETEFKPQEEKTFDLAFTVKYPKGKIVPGL